METSSRACNHFRVPKTVSGTHLTEGAGLPSWALWKEMAEQLKKTRLKKRETISHNSDRTAHLQWFLLHNQLIASIVILFYKKHVWSEEIAPSNEIKYKHSKMFSTI